MDVVVKRGEDLVDVVTRPRVEGLVQNRNHREEPLREGALVEGEVREDLHGLLEKVLSALSAAAHEQRQQRRLKRRVDLGCTSDRLHHRGERLHDAHGCHGAVIVVVARLALVHDAREARAQRGDHLHRIRYHLLAMLFNERVERRDNLIGSDLLEQGEEQLEQLWQDLHHRLGHHLSLDKRLDGNRRVHAHR